MSLLLVRTTHSQALCAQHTRKLSTVEGMATRSPEIPVHEWWIDLAIDSLELEKRPLQELGRVLQQHVARAEPFSHSVISRFKSGDIGVTLDLAQALVLEYALPPPVFFPNSRELALELLNAVNMDHIRRHKAESKSELPNVFGQKPTRKRQRNLEGSASDEFRKLREKTKPRK